MPRELELLPTEDGLIAITFDEDGTTIVHERKMTWSEFEALKAELDENDPGG